MNKVRSFLGRPLVILVGSRYYSFSLNFIRGIIIANALGPYYFGIWGFLTLILQYLTISSLGLEHAVTVELSKKETNSKYINKYLSVSILPILLIGIILSIIGYVVSLIGVQVFEKFSFNSYVLIVIWVSCSTQILQIFTNIVRIKKAFFTISIIEMISATVLTIISFVFKDSNLIMAILTGMLLLNIGSIVVYFITLKQKITIHFSLNDTYHLLKVGIPLLIYNFSFYLIMVSGRTILSGFFSIETLGYYTLANSVATATLLSLRTIAWSVFPDIIHKITSNDLWEEKREYLNKINSNYQIAVFLLVYSIIILIPVFLFLVPDFVSAQKSISILILAQGVLSVSFAYNSLAISMGKNGEIAKISIISVIIVIISSLSFSLLKFSYEFIALSVLFSSLVFFTLQTQLGKKILAVYSNTNTLKNELLTIGNIIAFLCFIVGIFSRYSTIWNLTGFSVFIFENINSIKALIMNVFSRSQRTNENINGA